jgi:hypothetical protein
VITADAVRTNQGHRAARHRLGALGGLGEHVITDLPDGIVEAAEGFGDALRGDLGGQVDGRC